MYIVGETIKYIKSILNQNIPINYIIVNIS